MSTELVLYRKPGIYHGLSQAELGALSAMFRSARRTARNAHTAYWWSLPVSDDLSKMISEFSALDPLFGKRKS